MQMYIYSHFIHTDGITSNLVTTENPTTTSKSAVTVHATPKVSSPTTNMMSLHPITTASKHGVTISNVVTETKTATLYRTTNNYLSLRKL